jgi:hypothetical protein
MCDDHGVTRRQVLYGAGALAAAAALPSASRPSAPRRLPLRSAARPATPEGLQAYSMAMHIHSSFSEKTGSMDAQLFQATANSVDVLWWSDHAERMYGWYYRDVVHFTSLTREAGAPGQGGAWHWQVHRSGTLSSASGGGIVTRPITPNDPDPHGSLEVTAEALAGTARYGFFADAQPADWNYRDNLAGQSLSIDVLPGPGWSSGYLEIAIASSRHPASAGRPAGDYALSYRIVPDTGRPGTRSASGLTGIITVPVQAYGQTWTTVRLDPAADIAALWPDLDYRDFALFGLTLSAVSTGDRVSGYFGYLRFNRTMSGGELFTQQRAMMDALAPQYPAVTQLQGTEISWPVPHVNWFGNAAIPDYSVVTPQGYPAWVADTVIPQIHAAGGLASYNHPYGTSLIAARPQARQDALLTQIATDLLQNAAIGTDILEVGYPLRSGVDLAHHLALWDVMSRNGIFLTGSGTSDDHLGQDWAGEVNNWTTSAWAASEREADLLAALAAGQVWCGSLTSFPTSTGAALNVTVDGTCPMGSVSLSGLPSRQLAVTATSIPMNGSVQVLQGAVDYAGTANPAPDTAVIGAYTDAEMADSGGQRMLAVDTSAESFVRTVVLDSAGEVVAASNPLWMLRQPPPNGIPGPRQA